MYVCVAGFVAMFVGWLWWSAREFELPGEHWMTKAFAKARGWASDAELVAIEGKFVRPDGVADLEQPGARWDYVFRSNARATAAAQPAPASTIPGAPAPPRATTHGCFQYSLTRGSGRQSNLVSPSAWPVWCQDRRDEAKTGSADPPRCSIRQVWQRAKQLGAPDPGYAEIRASFAGEAWRWDFQIAGHIAVEIPDDC